MRITTITDVGGVATTPIDTTVEKTSDFSSLFADALSDKPTLSAIFKEASETYGVDENLLRAIAKAESDFDPNCTSRSGAMGIMQLMPGTAKELGVTDAYDPRQNIMGGAKYIAYMLDRYDGNLQYALAAYNAGGGNVDKYGGIPPFTETQNYVAKIMGYLQNGEVEIPNDWSVRSDNQSNTITDALRKLFTYEDYEDFLRLFLERLSLRLDEKAAQIASENDISVTQAVVDAKENTSDAYIAYRNFGNTNRIAVYLKASETDAGKQE
ncbi:MAG: lytic transglycosylase domain-containing protein [bacterium]|nr:lytic transglycosylase domain-containing protein [bacterium]